MKNAPVDVATFFDIHRHPRKHGSVACAYSACEVRLKRSGWSVEDKNNLDDFRTWCGHLLDPDDLDIAISTFMCAHREADEEDANKLVKKLKTKSFVRTIQMRAFHVRYNGAYEFGSRAPIIYLRRSNARLEKMVPLTIVTSILAVFRRP